MPEGTGDESWGREGENCRNSSMFHSGEMFVCFPTPWEKRGAFCENRVGGASAPIVQGMGVKAT